MRQQRTPRTLDEQKRAQQSFGGAVRELRAARGFSQETLGFRSSLHRNYVGALERGEVNPTFKTLLALAGGLHVELSSLTRLFEERHEFHDAPHRWIYRKLGPAAPQPSDLARAGSLRITATPEARHLSGICSGPTHGDAS